ncbi:MAG TPA: hypothetical protein VGJ74_05795 [Burkholderiales bacterium]|jgi:hypothetical protein
MRRCVLFLALASLPAFAQQAEIQRALIERDRQSAEFARPELRELHSRRDQQHLPVRPDERVLESREREAFPTQEKLTPAPSYPPLPLPGGPRHGVDPIPVQGVGG